MSPDSPKDRAPRRRTATGGQSEESFLRQGGRGFLLTLYAALRSLQLYPVENAAVQKSLDDLQLSAKVLLGSEDEIEIRLAGEFIFVNATRLRLELENYASFSNILTTLKAADIGILRVQPNVERREWQVFLGQLLASAARPPSSDKLIELQTQLVQAGVVHILPEPSPETEKAPADAEEAKKAAKMTYAQGVAVTKEVMSGARMGRTPSLKKVKRVVQTIVDQVLNNETSLVGLTAIRDYDEYTFTHSVNVCIFAVALGKRLGFSKVHLYDLGMAALLHDIGKSRIPSEVLNKEGGLSDEEWRTMQSHPWLGALTLFNLRGYGEVPYRAVIVAHEHHMKIDMSGYPRTIRPRELGMFSRIVAVADGFDAATTRRSYQTVPIQPDQVLREMWDNPRRGVDRVVVKALINLLGVYPVGTVVVLDTLEVGIVQGTNPDPNLLNRPLVRIAINPDTGTVPPPGGLVNLGDQDRAGHFARTIVKVTNPDRYGLVVGDYLV